MSITRSTEMTTQTGRMAGVVAAAFTPLADGRPDARRMIQHCRWLLANGCDGVNLLGTTGEALSLSMAARLSLMEAVASYELPLSRFMVGTGANALSEAVTLTRAAVTLGFAAALVIPPSYYKALSDDGVFGYYASLVEGVADPRLRLYLYHFPALSGVPFNVPLVERLATAYPETIVGLKDSSVGAGLAADVAAHLPDLVVFPSAEDVLSDAPRLGYAGCISATVNVTAPLAAAVYRAALGGKPDLDAQAELTQIRATLAAHPLIPAVRHVAANLWRDERLKVPLPPLVALDSRSSAELDRQLERSSAFLRLADAVREWLEAA